MIKKLKTMLLLTGMLGLQLVCMSVEAAKPYVPGRVVVANRTSGTLSIIDEKTGQLLKNVPVQGRYSFARPPEPMYVNYQDKLNRLLVNDRTNNQVIALDARDYHIINVVPIPAGAFHMWSDGVGKQTWVVGDIGKKLTVIDPKGLKVLKEIDIPDNLSSGKPHDVLLDKKGKNAFVTIVGVTGDNDWVLQYSTKTFQEVARFAVGKDPHVGILNSGKPLFVPTEQANKVYVLDPTKKLAELVADGIDVPGAHGATWTPDGKFFYTSNLPRIADDSGNDDVLWVIDTKKLEVASTTPIDAGAEIDYPGLKTLKPHNLTINGNGTKLYLTHSGHEENTETGILTIYDINPATGALSYSSASTVGINPFGITYVPGK